MYRVTPVILARCLQHGTLLYRESGSELLTMLASSGSPELAETGEVDESFSGDLADERLIGDVVERLTGDVAWTLPGDMFETLSVDVAGIKSGAVAGTLTGSVDRISADDVAKSATGDAAGIVTHDIAETSAGDAFEGDRLHVETRDCIALGASYPSFDKVSSR